MTRWVLILMLAAAACGDTADADRADSLADGADSGGQDTVVDSADASEADSDAENSPLPEDTQPEATTGADTDENAQALTIQNGGETYPAPTGYFGLSPRGAGVTPALYIELSDAPAGTCPTEESPAPSYVLILNNVVAETFPVTLTEDDGVTLSLLDFSGDLLPVVPSQKASSFSVTLTDGQLCPSCLGDPAPSQPDSFLDLVLEARFEDGVDIAASGRVTARHCDSFDQ